MYPVKSGIGCVMSSFGIDRIGICVTEPEDVLIMPARSNNGSEVAVQIARKPLSAKEFLPLRRRFPAAPRHKLSCPSG